MRITTLIRFSFKFFESRFQKPNEKVLPSFFLASELMGLILFIVWINRWKISDEVLLELFIFKCLSEQIVDCKICNRGIR